jgi:3-keto-disaccharide hydrolase
MKFLLSLLALSAVAIAEPNKLTDAEKAAGWRLLFDGKTTNGWVGIGKSAFPNKGWSVEDGTLKTAAKGGGGDIVTSERFDDFELEWEWRIAQGGNSGLKYNLPDPNKGVGCEYQMIDDAGHLDAKLNGGTRTTASLYDVLKPADDKKLKTAGEWNSSRVVVKGNHVEHWLNGAKTVEFEFGSDELKAAVAKSKFKNMAAWGVKTKSPILIQDHGDEVAVRSIKIKTPAAVK